MNRRTAMLLTLLLGGLLSRGVFAQVTGRRSGSGSGSATKGRSTALEPVKRRRAADDDGEAMAGNDEPEPAPGDDPVPAFPGEPGQKWREFPITRYTSLDHSQSNPQNAIVEWIFRRTGSACWHGEKIAALSASRTKIRAYNEARYLDQAAEVIERFTNAVSDVLSVRVRFVAAVDTRWRYAVYSRLTPVGSGPQGQSIWTLKVEDAAFVLAQMQVYQGFRLLANQQVDLVNGQTLTVKTTEQRGFTGGMARESAVGLGYQPKAEQLEEGVTLRLSPLLTYDGDSVDAAIDLTANTVRSLHRTKVIAPREIGPAEITIDVPEVVESRLNHTVKGWPLGQTLLISAGIHPGILQEKGGFMNLRIPGTMPTGTELLVFLDAESASRPRRAAARERD
jgi:hypothetical protein